MNEALRNQAIDVTRRHLIRQGSRRISMDMIAREMHISKRTLYVLFSDKQNLVGTCLSEMRKEYAQKVEEYFSKSSSTAREDFDWLLHEYLYSLYEVDYSFLLDMQYGRGRSDFHDEHQSFWQKIFERILLKCREDGCVIEEFSISSFTRNLLIITNKWRIEGFSYHEQESFCKILVRGIGK